MSSLGQRLRARKAAPDAPSRAEFATERRPRGRGGRRKTENPPETSKRGRHAPQEVSARVKPPRVRQVVVVPHKESRDPRFDPAAGRLDYRAFREDYEFLDDIHERDIKTVREQLRKAKSKERKTELQREVTRLEQQRASQRVQDGTQRSLDKVKAQQKAQVASGKNPFFLKRRQLKELALAERFKLLEEKGGRAAVERAIRKRREKNAQKDRKRLGNMPHGRRDVDEEDVAEPARKRRRRTDEE